MKGFGLNKKPIKPKPDPRRLLICGDRNWHDVALIKMILKSIGPENIKVVIEGGCRGVDVQAREAAKALGIEFLEFPADWNKYPKAAGPIRNRQMIKEGKWSRYVLVKKGETLVKLRSAMSSRVPPR